MRRTVIAVTMPRRPGAAYMAAPVWTDSLWKGSREFQGKESGNSIGTKDTSLALES